MSEQTKPEEAQPKADAQSNSPEEDKSKAKKSDKPEPKKIPVVVPSKEFNLAHYMGSYDGHTKVARLQFIAERYVEKQAFCYTAAIEELKKGRNTATFRKIMESEACEKLGLPMDLGWADGVDKQVAIEIDSLDAALTNYKTNQDRKKIRSTYNKLGELAYERGDFNGASRNFMRSTEHCLTPETQLTLYYNTVRNAIAWGTFSQIHSNVDKAEKLGVLQSKENIGHAALFRAGSALADLDSSRYNDAARKFTQVNPEGLPHLREIISAEDIAIYGSLCALAEWSRESLKDLISGSNFCNILESVPAAGAMLSLFCASDYAGSLSILETFKNDLQLDIHMYDHIERLYTKIRNKALTEYFQPYSSVDLEKMAAAFKTSVDKLESELAELINNNQIQARIDSFNKCLVSRTVTQRTQTYSKTIEAGEALQAQARAMLLRVSLTQNNMSVKPEKGQGLLLDKTRIGPGMAAMAGLAGLAGAGNMQGRRN